MKRTPSFAGQLKAHMTEWAQTPGVRSLQTDGTHDWVLQEPSDNYFEPAWEAWLDGKSHKWGHALNSSQAFAINLFGPARENKSIAKALWAQLWSGQDVGIVDDVSVCFEYSGEKKSFAREWLGEKKQPTQVDVALKAKTENTAAILLIEVKLSESEFGCCRGPTEKGRDNVKHPCEDFQTVLRDPSKRCWLADTEKRKYWDLMDDTSNGVNARATDDGHCPWGGSLYQVMRNWSLSRALQLSGHVKHVEVAVCVHPWNRRAMVLDPTVSGIDRVVDAFNSMLRSGTIREINPRDIIDISASAGAGPTWQKYMGQRYFPESLAPSEPSTA